MSPDGHEVIVVPPAPLSNDAPAAPAINPVDAPVAFGSCVALLRLLLRPLLRPPRPMFHSIY